HTTGYSGLLARVAWSANGSILYAGNTATKAGHGPPALVFAWKQGGRGSLQVFPAAENTISDIQELPGGRVVLASTAPSVSVFDRTGSVLWQHGAPGAHFEDQATALKVSPDGKQALFGFERGGSSMATFDIIKRTLDLTPTPDPGLIAART